MKKILLLLLVTFNLFAYDNSFTKLKPETQYLLIKEMNFIKNGMDNIFLGIISNDFNLILMNGRGIENSFIFKKKLTIDIVKELKNKLPDRFMKIDNQFHEVASELANNAEFEDMEGIQSKYNEMINLCIKCHSDFAIRKFPNFKNNN